MQLLQPLEDRYVTDNKILDLVKEKLEYEIIGYDSIKKLIYKIIYAGLFKPKFKKIHLLLTGAPATGKTVMIKSIFEAIGQDRCIYYDATMATRVGLLDHILTYGSNLSNVRYICLDELDKMPKTHQFGVLNALESGIMQENKYKRHRHADLRHVTFFATSNEINKVYRPLASRFMVMNMKPYTEQQFREIGLRLLNRKYDMPMSKCEIVVNIIQNNLSTRTMRSVVQLATLIDDSQDEQDMLEVFKEHKLDFE